MQKSNYWADLIAEEIIKKRGKNHIVATGITPSGPIHLGNIREVVTGDVVFRALVELGAEAKLIYVADTADPLRKVYPFLPLSYERYVGMPLYRIPDPEGCHSDYTEHFLSPFLTSIEKMGIRPLVYRSHELYEQGYFAEVISEALLNTGKIKTILKEKTKRALPDDWMPFNVECESCHSMTKTKISEFSVDNYRINYVCDCGKTGEIDYRRGGGKLPWRIDWPARWKILNVTVEPFGKDHATAGGSYDTGVELSKQVFNYEPPFPILYEWIYLKGKGAMASSTGVAISISDMLKVVPPELIRYLILRVKPEKHIDFDPGNGLLQSIDEYQETERAYFGAENTKEAYIKRAYELSQVSRVSRKLPPQVPFTHLVIACQIAGTDAKVAASILKRSGYLIDDLNWLSRYLSYAQEWLTNYASES
ncbi:MAG: lysine--tRNA ligase, partial [Candidatus Subteraquimicrobiales bacterium]|nr:lysine--tRNA ligase [Candidatus Subteraquimicrobiales bacterium]